MCEDRPQAIDGVTMDRYSDYDPFADLYNRRWGWFAASILPVLDRLALDDLDDGATVLDLCCGTGQLLAALGERSFHLIGIDGSAEMVGHASRNAPDAELLVDDARSFETDRPVDAVVSTFDSLNHLMTADDLAAVFRQVAAVLRPGGRFVFDLNTDEGFRVRWQGPFNLVGDDEVIVARSTYDEEAGTASLALTCFAPLDGSEQGSVVAPGRALHRALPP